MGQAKTVLFAAGGTSGHIHPAIAVANELKEQHPNIHIVFCGTDTGIESDIVPRAGFEFVPIDAKGFPRRINKALFEAAQSFRRGRMQAIELVKRLKPAAVMGTGGYVCSPLLAAAKAMDVPRLIHEQNAFPGRSNRFMSNGADVVCISYENTRSYFKRAKRVVYTGNPVRSLFESIDQEAARKELNLPLDQRIILAMGGSLGARRINLSVVDCLLKQTNFDGKVIVACGQKMYEETLAKSASIDSNVLCIHPYLYDAHLYMAAADLMICRAGAITCAEVAALGKPAIMVPYPYATADHQTYNARVYSDVGASILCPDEKLTGDWLADHALPLLADEVALRKMSKAIRALAKPNAVQHILYELLRIMGEV